MTNVGFVKFKRHNYCLYHLNETSYKVRKCMDQQRIALAKHYQMFQLSATVPNLCPQPKSSLINHLINDRLLDA